MDSSLDATADGAAVDVAVDFLAGDDFSLEAKDFPALLEVSAVPDGVDPRWGVVVEVVEPL